MTAREQNIGKHGEQLAMNTLRALGLEMVEKIGTPVKLQPARIQGTYRVIFGEKVSGDCRAILPGGRSVLIETKTMLDHNLRWSDLREHQPGRLDRHSELGGISLLVWVHNSGVYVMGWPVPNFGPGRAINLFYAGGVDAETRRALAQLVGVPA